MVTPANSAKEKPAGGIWRAFSITHVASFCPPLLYVADAVARIGGRNEKSM
jgi:hypothetical protein